MLQHTKKIYFCQSNKKIGKILIHSHHYIGCIGCYRFFIGQCKGKEVSAPDYIESGVAWLKFLGYTSVPQEAHWIKIADLVLTWLHGPLPHPPCFLFLGSSPCAVSV